MIKCPAGPRESTANLELLLIPLPTLTWKSTLRTSSVVSKPWRMFLLVNSYNSRTDRKTNQLSQMMLLSSLLLKISLIRTSESVPFQESPMVKDNMIEHLPCLVVDKSLKVMTVLSTGTNKQSSNWSIKEKLLRETMPSTRKNSEENRHWKRRRLRKNDYWYTLLMSACYQFQI